MPDSRTQIVGMKDIPVRRPRVPPRSRLGRTWQDESWRQKLVGKLVGPIPPVMFPANRSERAEPPRIARAPLIRAPNSPIARLSRKIRAGSSAVHTRSVVLA